MDKKVFLFPLNNSLLMRKVTLPYHIFEPRYRQMIKASVDHEIPIAVIPLNSSHKYQGEVCIAGLPHILKTYPDGQMDIFISGETKCRLTDFEAENPYLVYRYTELEENLYLDDSVEQEMESLRIILERWAKNFLPDVGQRNNFSRTLEDPEVLVNYCAIFLIDDIYQKKAVIEATTMKQKVAVLLRAIGPKEISLGPFLPKLRF